MNKKEAEEIIGKSLIDFAIYIDEVCSESKEKKDKIIKTITSSLDDEYVEIHQRVMNEKNKLDDVTNKIAKLDDIINFKNMESDEDDVEEDVVVDLKSEKKTVLKKCKKTEVVDDVVNSDLKKVKKIKKEVIVENDVADNIEVETKVKNEKKIKKVEDVIGDKKDKKSKKTIIEEDALPVPPIEEEKKIKNPKLLKNKKN